MSQTYVHAHVCTHELIVTTRQMERGGEGREVEKERGEKISTARVFQYLLKDISKWLISLRKYYKLYICVYMYICNWFFFSIRINIRSSNSSVPSNLLFFSEKSKFIVISSISWTMGSISKYREKNTFDLENVLFCLVSTNNDICDMNKGKIRSFFAPPIRH